MKKLYIIFFFCFSFICFSQTFGTDINAEKAYKAAMKAYEAQEYQKAIYAFQNSIRYDPLYYKSYYMLGLTYILNDEPEQGEETLLSAIREFPLKWNAYILLAEYYATHDQYDSSIRYYQQALDLTSMPRKEKRTYQAKMNQVIKQRRSTWSVSEAGKKEILSSLNVPLDFTQWRAALIEKRKTDFHIAYSLKEEDYKANKWKKSLDITCSEVSNQKNTGFSSVNEWLASYYRKLDADLDTIEETENSRIFETFVRKPSLFIVGRIFPTKTGFCIAQYLQKSRMKENERQDSITLLKKINIK